MAQYLYKTTLYTDTTNVINVPSDNATNLTDYETNHQSSTVKIDDLQLAETTFEILKSYDDFDALITTPYDWGDVKEVVKNNRYDLYLITSSALQE